MCWLPHRAVAARGQRRDLPSRRGRGGRVWENGAALNNLSTRRGRVFASRPSVPPSGVVRQSVTTATIDPIMRLRISKTPLWFGLQPSAWLFLRNSLLIRVVFAALDGELFAVGQHDLAQAHGIGTILRAIP